MQRLLLFISVITSLISCTFTTTKSIDPIFSDTSTIRSELRRTISAENINLDGKQITTDGKLTTEMDINIINGKDVPTNEAEIKNLGKSIAEIIKNNLKNKDQFETYKVLFVSVVQTGFTTKRHWVGHVFNSKEL